MYRRKIAPLPLRLSALACLLLVASPVVAVRSPPPPPGLVLAPAPVSSTAADGHATSTVSTELATRDARIVHSGRFLARYLAPAVSSREERVTRAARAAALVERMTLREKVGQMTQLEIGMISEGEDDDLRIDDAKLHKAIVEYGVGSILNVRNTAYAPERWHEILRRIQAAAATTRLDIPVLYGLDSIHGANYVRGATLFPQPLGQAASWDPELVLRGAAIAAAETRAAGVPWNFSPVLDIGRQPLWPRLYETYGEDPYLASVMGVATVRGYEGSDVSDPSRVASSLKHYVGYSGPTTGHDRTPALIPELTLREYFLPPFAAGIRAGARTLMVNSGEVNGIPGHVNRWLLEDVLRGELGFRGVVVSDWEDIGKLVTIHRVAADEREATRMAVLAGIDMSMVPSSYSFSDLLVELVEAGEVPEARIDESVARILELKMELGLFEDPLRGLDSGVEVGSEASWRVAGDLARASVTLLQNEGPVLPLAVPRGTSPSASGAAGEGRLRLLVTGPTADSRPALNNGWTLTWQGDREDLYPDDRPTVLGAIRERAGIDNVVWVPGSSYDEEIDVAAAAAAAADADVAVVCLGEMSYAETPGNIEDLTLPRAQLRLARAVLDTGTLTVLVLLEGRPRILQEVADRAAAVVMAYNPGPEGGRAVAEVLFGDVNPSGRLPITYPRHPNALRTYDHKAFEELDTEFGLTGFRPQYEFGHGLSYTTFAYSDLSVTPRSLDLDGPGGEADSSGADADGDDGAGAGGPAVGVGEIGVEVTVANTGDREGAEVVMLFVSDLVASITPPVQRLRRFAKVTLAPGESRRIAFRLGLEDLAFVGPDHRRVAEPGAFRFRVGGLEADFELRGGPKRLGSGG